MKDSEKNRTVFGTDWRTVAGAHRFSHIAMATTFEIYIFHDDSAYAAQAARAAFAELDRLENDLSRFVPNSDVSRINGYASKGPVTVGIETFECLKIAERIYQQTKGAFDITAGGLVRCWFNEDRTPRKPSKSELDTAMRQTGMNLVCLEDKSFSVKFLADGVFIDLGGIGKGYAIKLMAEVLGLWHIDNALVHSGATTAFALGHGPGTCGWPVTISDPADSSRRLIKIVLSQMALSGSGNIGRLHIIDPRKGTFVRAAQAAWAGIADPAVADALSTAFVVMTPSQVRQYCLQYKDVLALVALADDKKEKSRVFRYGPWEKYQGIQD